MGKRVQSWKERTAKLKGLRPGNLKKFSRKKKIIIGVIILAVIFLSISLARCSRGEEPMAAQYIDAVVQRGNVQNVIRATGAVEFARTMPLSFEVGGTIQEILVKEGDVVEEGQALVRLETTTLEQALKEATENYESEQSGYEQKMASMERQLKSALLQAEKNLLAAEKEADPFYLENQYYLAELNVKAASEKLANAQSAGAESTYDLQQALSQARLNLADAKYLRDGGAAKELEVAQAEYEAARKGMQDFQKGVSPEYLSAKAALTTSETKLVEARENLDNAILKAPMEGTVVACEAELYSAVGEEKAVMSLVADPQIFTITASVDQTEIPQVKIGQRAEITLDTLPEEVIEGTVSGVSLTGTNNGNVITYDITIKVDEPSTILRDQMNVNVAIVIEQVEDVLVIPSQAVITRGAETGVLVPQDQQPAQEGQTQGPGGAQESTDVTGPAPEGELPAAPEAGIPEAGIPEAGIPDGSAGQANDGEYTFVPIEIGLDDGTNVEVISGLSEGQAIVMQAGWNMAPGAGGQMPGGMVGVPMGGGPRG